MSGMNIKDLDKYYLSMVNEICDRNKGVLCQECVLFGQCANNYTYEKIEEAYDKLFHLKDITVTESEILCCLGEYNV
jgi:hypothetical protein